MHENLYGYHCVFTLHNSRTSERMKKFKVQKGKCRILSLKEEIELTKCIGEIIKEKGYRCVAYNICKDHVHLLLISDQKELTKTVGVIKGKSSFLFGKRGYKEKGVPLWSQKFFDAQLNEWNLARLSKIPGVIYGSTYLDNTLAYILNNRVKHKLELSIELEEVIDDFVISVEDGYDTGWFNDTSPLNRLVGHVCTKKAASKMRPFKNGWKTGFEPATLGTTNRCSNQLSYNHHI